MRIGLAVYRRSSIGIRGRSRRVSKNGPRTMIPNHQNHKSFFFRAEVSQAWDTSLGSVKYVAEGKEIEIIGMKKHSESTTKHFY